MSFDFANWNILKSILNFIPDYLKKPGSGYILFIFSIVGGVWLMNNQVEKAETKSYNLGKDFAKSQVKSLNETIKSDSAEMYKLNGRVAFYKSKLDNCENEKYDSSTDAFRKALKRNQEMNEMLRQTNEQIKKELQ